MSFSITSMSSPWEGSSPLPPDSMALHLDEADKIGDVNPVEDELRSRMGLRAKAARVVVNTLNADARHSPTMCKEPCRPKPAAEGVKRKPVPALEVSDLKKLLSQHNASLRKR